MGGARRRGGLEGVPRVSGVVCGPGPGLPLAPSHSPSAACAVDPFTEKETEAQRLEASCSRFPAMRRAWTQARELAPVLACQKPGAPVRGASSSTPNSGPRAAPHHCPDTLPGPSSSPTSPPPCRARVLCLAAHGHTSLTLSLRQSSVGAPGDAPSKGFR